MNMCTIRASVDRHFAGTISPKDERSMREHLPSCRACTEYYGRHLLLAQLDPKALPAEDRMARGLGLQRPRAPLIPLGAVAVIAAAAALLLFVRSGAFVRKEQFTARGKIDPIGAPASRVLVYDVRDGETPRLASDALSSRDELAFAYENGAAKSRLMIFGVDEHRHVYWFYPAWSRASDNPVAVPIESGAGRHELPEAIRHDFDGTRLSIRAVFTDSPITVREVEKLLHDDPALPLPLPGAIESGVSLGIVP